MFLSEFSIKRPEAMVVIIIGLMALGILALTKLRVNTGGYQTAFKLIDELINRPGEPAAITDAVKAAHQATDDVETKMDGLMAGLPYAGGSAPISIADFNTLCNSPFDEVLNIGYTVSDSHGLTANSTFKITVSGETCLTFEGAFSRSGTPRGLGYRPTGMTC